MSHNKEDIFYEADICKISLGTYFTTQTIKYVPPSILRTYFILQTPVKLVPKTYFTTQSIRNVTLLPNGTYFMKQTAVK